MRKYFNNLDDYNDYSSSSLMELVKQALPTVIFIASLVLMFAVCGSLEVM